MTCCFLWTTASSASCGRISASHRAADRVTLHHHLRIFYESDHFLCKDVLEFVFCSSSVNGVFLEAESRQQEEDEEDPDDSEGRSSRLWVDRFSPRHYTELLSDDVRACLSVLVHVNIQSVNEWHCWVINDLLLINDCSLPTAVCWSGWNSGTLLCLEKRGSPVLFDPTDRLTIRRRLNPIRPIRITVASRARLKWLKRFWRLSWISTNDPSSRWTYLHAHAVWKSNVLF